MEPSTPSLLEPPREPAGSRPAAQPEPTAQSCVKTWTRELGPAGPLAAVMIVLPMLGGLALLGFLNRLGPWLKSHESS